MARFLLFVCVFFINIFAIAQNPKATLSGHLIDKNTERDATDIELYFPKLKQINSCDVEGNFSVSNLPYGTFTIIFRQNNEAIDSLIVSIDAPIIELGNISIANYTPIITDPIIQQKSLPTIALENDLNNLEDEGIANTQNISIALNAAGNRDPFLNTLSFVFGQYNFKARGYNRSTQNIYINGLLLNDANTGNAIWAQFSGLNDVMRNQNNSYGLSQSEQGIGGLNGSIAYDVNAAVQSPQTKLTYSLANRSYNNRIMLSHHTGTNKKGWAFSISASRRWAVEAYIPGTSFDAYSGFASASKQFNEQHQLSFNIIAAHSARARSGTAIQEVYDITNNHFYNPNWGYQNGEKRNARNSIIFQPIAMLNHSWAINSKTNFRQSLAYQTGSNQATSLDWYNAIDPRPDYYRNLPSYYQQSNPIAATQIRNTLVNNPALLQIDWARLYSANRNNAETLYGLNGNADDSFGGNRSLYVIGADVEKINKITYAATIQTKFSEQLNFSGGVQIIAQQSEYFRELKDLLGGDYFLNNNQFATQQFQSNSSYTQNDLETPNRAIKLGEKYRYDYKINTLKSWGWAQAEYNSRHWNLFAVAQLGLSSYSRDGMYRNGLFAQNSLGKSETIRFFNYAAKGGASYKINGRNYLVFNGFYNTEDAGLSSIFVAPRTRNQTVETPTQQSTQSVEFGYLIKANKLNIRAMGYATDVKNNTTIQRFYNDDPEYQSFVNFVMSGVNTRFIGTELAVEYAFNSMFTMNVIASLGQAFYTNKPNVKVYNDNDTNINPGAREVFIKNYYLGVGPQSAYTLGLNYNSKKYWYLKLNANYFERNYVAVNPSRRSLEAAELVNPESEQFDKIFDQELLPTFYTIDLSGGKSWQLSKISKRIKYGTMLYFNFGISNLFNNQKIKSFGFEQLRYDFTNNNPDKFPTKYIYGYGRTFFANLSFKF